MNEMIDTKGDNTITETEAAPKNNTVDINTAYTTLIARTETINIVVNILNALLNLVQSHDRAAFTQEDLQKIQAAVNVEIAKNEKLYEAIEKAMTKSATNIPSNAGLSEDVATN